MLGHLNGVSITLIRIVVSYHLDPEMRSFLSERSKPHGEIRSDIEKLHKRSFFRQGKSRRRKDKAAVMTEHSQALHGYKHAGICSESPRFDRRKVGMRDQPRDTKA